MTLINFTTLSTICVEHWFIYFGVRDIVGNIYFDYWKYRVKFESPSIVDPNMY